MHKPNWNECEFCAWIPKVALLISGFVFRMNTFQEWSQKGIYSHWLDGIGSYCAFSSVSENWVGCFAVSALHCHPAFKPTWLSPSLHWLAGCSTYSTPQQRKEHLVLFHSKSSGQFKEECYYCAQNILAWYSLLQKGDSLSPSHLFAWMWVGVWSR